MEIKQYKLKNLTWLKIGGETNFAYANSVEELRLLLAIATINCWKIFIIGCGSNILAAENLTNILVIKLGKGFDYISQKDGLLTTGCATSDIKLAKYALTHEISGIEFLATIPGSIGGAIAMNAGSYGSDISAHLLYVKALDMNGTIKTISIEEMGYKYRCHSLKENYIFLEATFKTVKDCYQSIQSNINTMLEKKNKSQPTKAKTCGSFFKNPPGYRAWQLIEDSGCRGLRYGDAMISENHANFIINLNNSTYHNIYSLYSAVHNRVKHCFNIELQLEVILIK